MNYFDKNGKAIKIGDRVQSPVNFCGQTLFFISKIIKYEGNNVIGVLPMQTNFEMPVDLEIKPEECEIINEHIYF